MNIKELSYVIKTTFGAPLDVRYVVSSLSELASELPQSLRYQGELVYIQDVDTVYIFKHGVTDADCIPFNQTDILSVADIDEARHVKIRFPGQLIFSKADNMYFTFDDGEVVPMHSSCVRIVETWDEALATNIQSRYIGQEIFVTAEGRMYVFRGGVVNSCLVPSENVTSVTSLSNVGNEYPTHARQLGQFVWIEDLKQLRVVDKNKTLIKVHNDVVTISSDIELTDLAKSDNRPYIVINLTTNSTKVWSDTYSKYIDIRNNSLITGETVAELLNNLSPNADAHERVEGQLYYIRSLGEHYTFVGGIADENFISIKSQYIIDSLFDIDTAIPTERRYVGQQFYVVDESQWYYFKDRVNYSRVSGFTQTVKTAIFSGDYELVHNRNTPSVLLSVRNSRGEIVDIPWRAGYLNEAGKTEAQLAYGMRNVISFSTDVYDTYTITILSA